MKIKQYFLLLPILFILYSCGFKPLYKTSGTYNNLQNKTSSIYILPIKNFDGAYGIELRNDLYKKLNPLGINKEQDYLLEINVQQPSLSDYTINNDGTASSKFVKIIATCTLKNKTTYEILMKKTFNSENSYNILKNQFSTEMLKENAIKLALYNLSEQIYFAIINYFLNK